MYLVVLVLAACVFSSFAQNTQNDLRSITRGLDQFALRLLAQTSNQAGESLNIALSPYTIWTLLTIIAEGARENTLRELENGLGLPKSNKDLFRNNFISLSNNLKRNAVGVTLDITNAIFATNEYRLNSTFQEIAQRIYNVDVIQTDFKDSRVAVNAINSYISRATRNRIRNFVNAGDVANAAIFMTSTLFFKGQWRYPFNKTATRSGEVFYDESGNQLGIVDMMYQAGPFPYSLITNLKAFAVELPYADGDKYSMIVLLPRKDVKLSTVLQLVAQTPVSELMETLAHAEQEYLDEDVEVFLPKFKIDSELNLDSVLSQLGIRDVFNSQRADLLGIFPQYLYLSRVLQKASIDVDEEGTVATAAAGGSFAYKTTQPKFIANKPFAFFIVDKISQSILFAGKISNPDAICDNCRRI